MSFHPQPSEGLPGVVGDLRLPAAKREAALALVSAHKPSRNPSDPNRTTLNGEMRTLLDDEEYENSAAAWARLSRSTRVFK
jgi:hypothetical protein